MDGNSLFEYKREKVPLECELLKRSALFPDEEIREILDTRKCFDYKIDNQLKSVLDFEEYIKYEGELLSRITEKRKLRTIQNGGDQKTILDQSVVAKIIRLYKRALLKYPEEYRIWENFIKFCKICKSTTDIQPYITKWISYHSDKADVWIQAMNYEYYEMQNIDKARSYIPEALKLHPKSKEFCTNLFKIELTEASKQNVFIPKMEPGTENEQQLQTKELTTSYMLLSRRAETLYEHAKRQISEIEFFIGLLTIAENYPFTWQLQDLIVLDLKTQFPGHELTWNTLAQRELKGYHINDLYSSVNGGPLSLENRSVVTAKRRIELCAKIYHTAANIMKTQSMWSHYIDAMIELNKNTLTQQSLKQNCLLEAYNGAHNAKCLSEVQYLQYIELLKSLPEDEYGSQLCAVMEKSTEIHNKSIELWQMYLQHYMRKNDEQKVYDIFAIASKTVGNQSLPLWELLKQFFLIKYTHEERKKTEMIFKEAIKQPEPISSTFKSYYIEWSAHIRGIDACRSLFRELLRRKPPCYQMHRKMLSINTQLLAPDRNKLSEDCINDINETKYVYEISIELFGETEPDIWIDYIKFERDYGNVKKMNVLFEKGKKQLKSHLLDNFLSQYDLVVNML